VHAAGEKAAVGARGPLAGSVQPAATEELERAARTLLTSVQPAPARGDDAQTKKTPSPPSEAERARQAARSSVKLGAVRRGPSFRFNRTGRTTIGTPACCRRR
jgi:hypothetical protein